MKNNIPNLRKNSFVLHIDSLIILDKLNDEQAGQFIKAIYQYQVSGILPSLDFALEIALTPFVNQFLRDNQKYEIIVEKNAVNGKKGGRPKIKKGNGFLEKPLKAKKADSDSGIGNDSVNVSKNEKIEEAFVGFEISKKLKNKILEFIEYRSEISKPYTSQKSIKALIEKLSSKNENVAIEEINQSIRNGWQGVFEVSKTNNKNSKNYEPKEVSKSNPKNLKL